MTDGLLGVVQRLADQVRALAHRVPNAPTWATVTSLDPLRVRPDGSTEVLEATPDNLAGPLAVGARVMIQVHGRKIVLFGPPVRVVQHGSDVTTNGDVITVGSPTSTEQTSFNAFRGFAGGLVQSLILYVANATGSPEVALQALSNGSAHSRLSLVGDGRLRVQTYGSSATVAAVRPLPFAMAAGEILITPSAANVVTSVVITLPADRFTQAPSVTVTPNTTAPHQVFAAVSSRSASSFQINLYRPSPAGTWVLWNAIQMEV